MDCLIDWLIDLLIDCLSLMQTCIWQVAQIFMVLPPCEPAANHGQVIAIAYNAREVHESGQEPRLPITLSQCESGFFG